MSRSTKKAQQTNSNSNTVTRPTTSNTVSRPTSSDTVTRPTNSNTVTRPTTSNTVSRPTSSDTVTRPSNSNTVTRPTTSNTVSRPTSSDTVTRPTTSNTTSSGRVDAPVGKGQYITDSGSEQTSGRVDAPAGKWQYITDSSNDLVITDNSQYEVLYVLTVEAYGGNKSRVNTLLGAKSRSNLQLPFQICYTEQQKVIGFDLAKQLLLAGAQISLDKEIKITIPLV